MAHIEKFGNFGFLVLYFQFVCHLSGILVSQSYVFLAVFFSFFHIKLVHFPNKKIVGECVIFFTKQKRKEQMGPSNPYP